MRSKLQNEEVLAHIRQNFKEDILFDEQPFGLLTIEVNHEKINEIIHWLKDHTLFQFSFLTLLGAIHYPNNKGKELGVNYHLHSLINNCRIRIRTYFSIEKPEIQTITDIFPCANWLERETYDFYGIKFLGHPNLTRILNDESMDYFPMRKEYHLEDATREDKDDRFFGR
ncbi:MAG: NADH-quinone oxidoreductase subunit C [Flavobacteriia bacterium]|nr:NADH-quinone oxidoreductase subunit C [Flavobacteriia bacterium]